MVLGGPGGGDRGVLFFLKRGSGMGAVNWRVSGFGVNVGGVVQAAGGYAADCVVAWAFFVAGCHFCFDLIWPAGVAVAQRTWSMQLPTVVNMSSYPAARSAPVLSVGVRMSYQVELSKFTWEDYSFDPGWRAEPSGGGIGDYGDVVGDRSALEHDFNSRGSDERGGDVCADVEWGGDCIAWGVYGESFDGDDVGAGLKKGSGFRVRGSGEEVLSPSALFLVA
jgi:hypothetical protein